MTITPRALFEAKFIETALTTQFSSTGGKTAIDKLSATNTGGSNATVTVHLLGPGMAAGTSNAITKTLTAGQTWLFPEAIGHLLEAGGAIATVCSTATVWMRGSGRQFT